VAIVDKNPFVYHKVVPVSAGTGAPVDMYEGTLQVGLASSRNLDAFGRLRVANPTALFSSKLLADAKPLYWDDQQTSGTGTSSTYNANQASVTLAVSANTAGVRARQTFQRFAYQPGKGQEIVITGIIGTPAAGITRRLGFFDGLNGPYFASTPTGVAVGHYTSTSGLPVREEVPQSAWNVDRMDGTGPSGLTLDWSKEQIFGISFQWLGVGSIWHFVEIAGLAYVVHRFDHANIDTLVSFSKPNLPVRYEIANDGTGGAASLTCICSTVVSSGGVEETGLTRAVYRNALALLGNNTNWHPVLAVRLRTGYEHAVVRFKKLSLNCQSTADFTWRLVLNPTIVGTALSFTTVTNDAVEVDTTVNTVRGSTTCTGGTDLDAASTQQSSNGSDVQLIATDPRLGMALDGTRDVIVLAVRRDTGGNEDFLATLSWRAEE